jgi:SRSO17 transposase
VAVSLSISTAEVSLPIAWRLYLPEVWTKDKKARKATGVPRDISFLTKPEIALQQIRTSLQPEIPAAPVLADAAYGSDTRFRDGITNMGCLMW